MIGDRSRVKNSSNDGRTGGIIGNVIMTCFLSKTHSNGLNGGYMALTAWELYAVLGQGKSKKIFGDYAVRRQLVGC
jgi:hypothetical protein